MKIKEAAGEMKKRMRAVLRKRQTLYGLIFVAGLLLALSPVYGKAFQRFRCRKAIEAYEQRIAGQEDAAQVSLLQEVREYNCRIAAAGAFGSFAAQAYAADREEALPDFGGSMMGWLEVPALETSVPIRSGQTGPGAAWLTGSSLPAGAADANCVLTDKGDLLGTLSSLQEGDYLYLHVLGQTLAYQVDQVETVDKADADQAAIQPGRDLLTLLDSAGGPLSADRLMIRATRTDYSPTINKAQLGKDQ